jgi:hypothetical protein
MFPRSCSERIQTNSAHHVTLFAPHHDAAASVRIVRLNCGDDLCQRHVVLRKLRGIDIN